MIDAHDSKADAADLINQATADVKERQKRLAEMERVQATARPLRQRASLAVLIVAIPVFAVLVTIGFTDWSLTALFEPRLSAPDARKQAEAMLSGVVAEIEAFRHDYHELPDRLIEVGIPARGTWEYTVLARDHYSVKGTLFGQRVTFNSAQLPLAAKD